METSKLTKFNPYAQNATVLNGFFKKPIVLILAIVHIAFGTCHLISFVVNHFLLTTFSFSPAFFVDLLSIALYSPMAIGYVIVYIKSKECSPLAGIKVLHTTSIVKLILTTIAMLFVVSAYNEIVNAVDELFEDWILGSVLFFLSSVLVTIVLVIIATIFAVALIFFISQIRFFSNIRKSLTTINITHKGSVLFAVANIILSAFTAFSFVGGILELFSGATNTSIRALMPTITLFFATVLFITNAVVALSYRNYINKNVFGYSQINTQHHADDLDFVAQSQTLSQPPTQTYKTYEDLQNEAVANCPYCNAKVKPDTVFCSSCGKKIK